MAATHILQNLVVRLSMNSTNYTRQMLGVIGATHSAAGQLSTIGHTLTRTVTLPLTIMGATAVYEFAKFDRAMGESLSIMGNVGPALRQEMEATARTLATTSVTSADKLAESYYYLAQSGMSAEEAINALGIVNNFAIAGMFDQAKATDLLTDSQMALGLVVRGQAEATAANMEWIGDVLVKASTLANASTEQFADALTTKSAAAMRFFNIEVEEGVAVLAAYSDMGKKGNEAGNMYDRSLRLLAKSVLTSADAHKLLGFEVYDANGEMRSMADIIDNLDQIMMGLSDQQRAATLSMLGFEARSQQAITPLLGMGEAMRAYEASLRDAAGFTDSVALKAQQTFSAQMMILWNRIKDVAIEIGQHLVPHLMLLAEVVTRVLELFKSLPTWLQFQVVQLAAVVAAIGPLVTGITFLITGYTILITQMEIYIGVAATATFHTWAMRTAMAGLAIGGIMVAAFAVEKLIDLLSGLTAQMKEADRLAERWASAAQLRMNKEIENIQKITDAKKKEIAIEEKRRQALRDVITAEKKKRAAERDLDQFAFTMSDKDMMKVNGQWMSAGQAKQNLKEATEQHDAYEKHLQRLEAMQEDHAEKMKAPVNEDTLKRLQDAGMPQDVIDSMDPDAIEKWEKDQEEREKRAAQRAQDRAAAQIDAAEAAIKAREKQEAADDAAWFAANKLEAQSAKKAKKAAEDAIKDKERAEGRLQKEMDKQKYNATSLAGGRGGIIDAWLAGGGPMRMMDAQEDKKAKMKAYGDAWRDRVSGFKERVAERRSAKMKADDFEEYNQKMNHSWQGDQVGWKSLTQQEKQTAYLQKIADGIAARKDMNKETEEVF